MVRASDLREDFGFLARNLTVISIGWLSVFARVALGRASGTHWVTRAPPGALVLWTFDPPAPLLQDPFLGPRQAEATEPGPLPQSLVLCYLSFVSTICRLRCLPSSRSCCVCAKF